MSTFDITKAFQYTLPTSSVEYIKNANTPTVGVPLTLRNVDATTPISLVINAQNTQSPLVKIYDASSTVVSNNFKAIQLAPNEVKLFSVVANSTSEFVNQPQDNIVQENILFNVVSGSVARGQDIVNINTASNDTFGVDINFAPEEFFKYNGRFTYTGATEKALGTYESFIIGESVNDPVFQVTKSDRVVYTRGQLEEKQRKLRIILDNFSQPATGYDNASASGPSLGIMKNNVWFFNRKDFPNMNPKIYSDPRLRPNSIYDGESLNGATVRLLKQAIANALFCEADTCGDDYPENYRTSLTFSDTQIPSTVTINGRNLNSYERVLWYCQNIVAYYLKLIDNILNTTDSAYIKIDAGSIESAQIKTPVTVKFTSYTVPLLDAILSASLKVISDNTKTFFNQSREYKTLLNFGNDTQYVAEAWRLAPSSSTSVQLKLLTPLDANVQVYDQAFISREIAKTVVDIIEFAPAPPVDNTPYLRPLNTNAIKFISNKKSVNGVTLSTLGTSTGSAGTFKNNSISYEDTVFRRWFTDGFNASELNIDFTNYNNFVYYGSAYDRLQAFSNKLLKIEELSTRVTASISSSTVGASLNAIEIENIVRNFDPYEQFLYYATQSLAYSASVNYVNGELEYNSPGTWPKKSDGYPYSPTSVSGSTWLTNQGQIAIRYDDNNSNYLIRHLPTHIQEDEESTDFLTLISMVGHFLDNIKIYIDQFPYIYSTNPNPFDELSMDQVYEVATSFGLKLPNVYSLTQLQSFVSSIQGESGSRSTVAETWKRFLHSAIYLTKTKGSRTSFDALLNTYGLNSPALQLKETSYPVDGNYIRSDELAYGLTFTSSLNNSITIPFVSASLTSSTMQITFKPSTRKNSSIVNGDQKWAIDLIPHPSASLKSTYGKIVVVSGSSRTTIASSSYFPLFSDDYTNIMLRSQSQDMIIVQTDGDQILYQESASVNLSSIWNTTQFIYLGGSGSIKLASFDGIVDELRLWNENITTDDFVAQAYDPGSYYGASYTSSYANLYVHLSFSQPLSSITQSATNESPYQYVSRISSLPATGFTTASYYRFLRSIKQYTPIVGSTIYTNKKVTVASAPTFNSRFIDGNGTKYLKRDVSIKQIEDKIYNSGLNVVSFAVSPTDFINQNILRTMGVVDVNNIIGSPRDITETGYSNLKDLKAKYLQYYNKTINPNAYTRFYKDLAQSPSEMATDMVPARTKLLDGIVIESSILDRNKTYSLRAFQVDGDNTKTFDTYVSGSASMADVGAYSFDAVYNIEAQRTFTSDILPLSGTIGIPDDVYAVSTTPVANMPPARKVYQYVNYLSSTSSLATSSLLDENSGFAYVEANTIDASPRGDVTSSGYPRNPYLGIPDRFSSEENTLIPFYNIAPIADFNDVGTTTYFHKDNGIYSYDLYTLYKQPYVVKLDTAVDSPLDRLFAKITLLSSGSLLNVPGRSAGTIPAATYPASSGLSGVIKIANIFTLIGIEGTSGLRVRLYRTAESRDADVTRSFSEAPALNSGVLFDGVLGSNSDVFPYTMVQTTDSTIYYNITNTTSTAIVSSVDLDYFAYEPANLTPIGYLPRHYKFNRDNGTALKRRNYLGCKEVDTTFDGEPPFKVTLSTGNTVVVNAATVNISQNGTTSTVPQTKNIQFGGGGTLNVE